MSPNNIKRLVLAAVCLALALYLPFLTLQIPEFGSKLLPMHFPIILCGFMCGWQYGILVGFVAPLLRFFLFGLPPIMPTGVAMAFELAAYGLFTGLLYRPRSKSILNVYVSLVVAMVLGRAVWGAAMVIILSVSGSTAFTSATFVAGAFTNAIPGIIAQIILIPILVLALRSANLMGDNGKKKATA